MEYIEHNVNGYEADTVIGVMWAIGMAIGIILIDLKPGYYVDLMSYLFGSILAVPRESLALMAVLDAVILATALALFKEFLGMSSTKSSPWKRDAGGGADYVMLLLIALTVIMLIRVVGLIMVSRCSRSRRPSRR